MLDQIEIPAEIQAIFKNHFTSFVALLLIALGAFGGIATGFYVTYQAVIYLGAY
jgi:hypothetical protein